jgi:sugar lactone lactonase YvrE
MKKLLVVLMAVLALPVFILGATPAKADTFTSGDVFAGVSNGDIQWWRPSTNTLIGTLNNGGLGGYTTGMAFDASGNLYGTNFSALGVTRYDTSGAVSGTNPFTINMVSPESIAFSAGQTSFYVGDAGGNVIRQFNTASGALMNSFTTATSARGTDWIDLAANNTTLYYTSEGNQIFRYDTVAGQLADFNVNPLPGSNAYALRILPGGGVLVADSSGVVKLDAAGNQIATYAAAQSAGGLFSLNLDPDGTSFWTGDFVNGNFFKFAIADGTLLQSFNTGTGGSTLFGLTVFGEQTVVNPNVPIPPSMLLFGSGLLGLAGWRRLRKA